MHFVEGEPLYGHTNFTKIQFVPDKQQLTFGLGNSVLLDGKISALLVVIQLGKIQTSDKSVLDKLQSSLVIAGRKISHTVCFLKTTRWNINNIWY